MTEKILVIGGGVYGMYLSTILKNKDRNITLVEKENIFMSRSSKNNQLRAHRGYHYPRNMLTAIRSKVLFEKFKNNYKDCIYDEYENYYLISKNLSNISSFGFKKFCDYLNLRCQKSTKLKNLIEKKNVDEVFLTYEPVYDPEKLKNNLFEQIQSNKINFKLNCEVVKLSKNKNKFFVTFKYNNEIINSTYDKVYNCTYSSLNSIVSMLDKSKNVKLKHELTEICLIKMPDEIRNYGITTMCGPFFSSLPYILNSSLDYHSFSHVRYTPHYYWIDNGDSKKIKETILTNLNIHKKNNISNYNKMIRDAERFIPIMSNCKYIKSNFEIKTVLQQNEKDDGRPILFLKDYIVNDFNCVLGSKIDNIYEMKEFL